MSRGARVRLVVAAGLVVAMACLLPGHGADAAGVKVTASVDGQALGTSSQNQPLKLYPRQQSVLTVTVTNPGPAAVNVTQVRLEGQVVGLTFFAYNTAVSMPVGPGQSETQHLSLDLSGLNGQATGLIPGAVQVLDAKHSVVAEQDGVVDVRGSLRSVYGLFGLGVALLTALSFLGALVGLARHRLQANRWRRGLRFLTPGLGLGLVVNFTLSATRVFVPAIGRWVTITVVCAVVLFAMGYLTPTPDLAAEGPDTAPIAVVDEYTVVALASGPRHFAVRGRKPATALAAPYSAQALAPTDMVAALPAPADWPGEPTSGWAAEGSEGWPGQGSQAWPAEGSEAWPAEGSEGWPGQGSQAWPAQESDGWPAQGSEATGQYDAGWQTGNVQSTTDFSATGTTGFDPHATVPSGPGNVAWWEPAPLDPHGTLPAPDTAPDPGTWVPPSGGT